MGVWLAFACVGCTSSVSLGEHDAGAPERCGPFDCDPGEVCCSPTCGLCVAEGASCIERHCGGPCDPFVAGGTGTCRMTLGFSFNGAACVVVAGCACAGIDCARLYPSAAACRAVHGSCSTSELCLGPTDCDGVSYCVYPGACSPGYDGAGTCAARPIGGCPASIEPVCGCDGVTYDNACLAAASGISVAYADACR